MSTRNLSNTLRQLAVYLMSAGSFFMFRRRRFLIVMPPWSKFNMVYRKGAGFRSVISVRVGSSYDYDTLLQIFGGQDYDVHLSGFGDQVQSEYARIVQSGLRPVILDLGANVGYSALFYGLAYPGARILAIEADEENCQAAQTNIALNQNLELGAIEVLNLAVVGSGAGPRVQLSVGDGNNAYRVVTQNSGEAIETKSVPAASLGSIMAKLGEDEVPFILKIDIEGAELAVFEADVDQVDRFNLICVEPHDWLTSTPTISTFLAFHAQKNRLFRMRNENVFSLRGSFDEEHFLEWDP